MKARQKGSSKKFLKKKVPKRFGGFKNSSYLCNRFRLEIGGEAKRFFEKFLKKNSEKFGRFKNSPYLCNRFRLENEAMEKRIEDP